MGLPSVAIVGATGYVGTLLTHSFLEAFREHKFKEVRLLTANQSKSQQVLTPFKEGGAQVHVVNFSRKETLLPALKGVDIVVSAMGTGPGSEESRLVLLEAMTQVGVDVYFPSEFGTNHYSSRVKLDPEMFQGKKQHFQEARAKPGLKVVRIHCSMIMEFTFGDWCGLDCVKRVWRLPGSGNTPVALTSCRDIGRFTVEAALLAFSKPDFVPESLEIVSDVRTLREFAAALDSAAGKGNVTKFQCISLEEGMSKYSTKKDFLTLFPLLFETGAFAVPMEEANGNAILNPGESSWKLKKFEEYAEETGGAPKF